jgi:hypothetical protein
LNFNSFGDLGNLRRNWASSSSCLVVFALIQAYVVRLSDYVKRFDVRIKVLHKRRYQVFIFLKSIKYFGSLHVIQTKLSAAETMEV